jgi:hypothetical protein
MGIARASSGSVGVALVHATQSALNGVWYERAAFRDGVLWAVISGSPGQSYATNEPNHPSEALRRRRACGRLPCSIGPNHQADLGGFEGAGASMGAASCDNARNVPHDLVHIFIPQNCMMEQIELTSRGRSSGNGIASDSDSL